MGTEAKDDFYSSRNIPSLLKDFGEVPSGYVSLFIEIPWRYIGHIAIHGLRIEDNQMLTRKPVLEEIFKRVGEKYGAKVNRTSCIFAYPRNPDQTDHHVKRDPSIDSLVEIKVDAERCIVVDGNHYTEAGFLLDPHWGSEDKNVVKGLAEFYWEESLSLIDYLRRTSKGTDIGEFDDFRDPEVLIPFDVPVGHIRIVE